jgi:ATP-dependent Zn protease
MIDRICMTLGGRAAEEIFFGAENITTGAQDDLQKITKMAFEACANYGMNDIIGPVSYGGREGARESWTKPFSEKTGEMLDAEVRKMIVTAHQTDEGPPDEAHEMMWRRLPSCFSVRKSSLGKPTLISVYLCH